MRTSSLVALAALVVIGGRGVAQPPLPPFPGTNPSRIPFGALPPQDDAPIPIQPELRLTPQSGDWLVCVASYVGPMSPRLAQGLAIEIRERYRMPAFVFNRGEDERRRQQEDIDRQRREQEEINRQLGFTPDYPARIRKVRIEDQCAVLIGGFKDDETARRALEKIKKLDPPQSVPTDTVWVMPPSEQASANPSAARSAPRERYEQVVNPFHTSFVTRNPLVPAPQADDKPDPLIKELNAAEEYSLLKCRKRWTLVVKDFSGGIELQQAESPGILGRLGMGRSGGQMLNAAALQAREVARVLRKMEFEAYVLHMRHGSLVTVGGFDSPNDPQLLQLQRTLGNLELRPVTQLLAQPLPMEIPRP